MSSRRFLAAACGIAVASLGINLMSYAQAGSKGQASHMSAAAVANTAATPSALDYTTSWIGNTYGGTDADPQHTFQHVPLSMNTVYATPDGTVYTNTPWEEGGRPVSVFKNGKLISPLDNGNNSQNWSNGGGVAVAADATHIFRGNGPGGTGVGLLDSKTMNSLSTGLTGSNTLDKAHVLGMATSRGKLYVAEEDVNTVDVFDLKSLSLVSSLPIPDSVRIAVDDAGGIWVSHRDHTPPPALDGNIYNINTDMGTALIDHYDAAGHWLSSITLPDNGEVGALWIDQHDLLLVGDDGPDQNIKVYGNLAHNATLITTIGVKGGNYADADEDRDHNGDRDREHEGWDRGRREPGNIGPGRFRGITGIATDAQDNLYVSQSGLGLDMGVGHGAILQSYTRWGHLNWQVEGLGFVSLASIDPESEFDAYDAYHHFKLDYSKTGNIGKYVGDTYHRFKYPDDVRVTSVASTSQVRYIQGRKFLLVAGQGTSYMEIFRFSKSESGPEKEIAIPCAAFDYGSLNGSYQDFVVQPTDAEFIWRDVNGDGQMSPDEITEPATEKGWRAGGDFWMDAKGDMWQVNYDLNTDTSRHLRRYLFQGFDAYGAPIYDFNHMQTYDAPADFPMLNDVEKAEFISDASDGGTLYVAGNKSVQGSFTNLQRIDNWDKGNRNAKWTVDIPWDPDPNNTWQPNSFSVAGDYLFLDYYRPHYILIYNVKDGTYVGKLVPGPEVGGVQAVGDTDEWQGVSAFRRPNGQYVVINEEDYQAKFLVYRWTPRSSVPPPTPQPPTNIVAKGGDEAMNLSWTGGPGALIYNVSRSSVKGGPYTLVDPGVVGNSVADPGLINGQTYYYVVSSLTETGPSVNSAEISGTAVAEGTTYEAENATLQNGGGIYQCPQYCSGGARVGAVSPGLTITLNNVTVPTTGTYAVRIYFTNGDNNPSDFGPMDITVNGSVAATVTTYPYSGDYSIPAPPVTFNLPLNAGINTIVLGIPATSQNGGPDIDRILVPFAAN